MKSLEISVCPADVQQVLETKEEVSPEQQEWSSRLDQQDPEPPHIKEEQEEFALFQRPAGADDEDSGCVRVSDFKLRSNGGCNQFHEMFGHGEKISEYKKKEIDRNETGGIWFQTLRLKAARIS
ncbi:gastrula zinc finger protein XlCGF57.1-like protein [Lates japonicus]|uniref:Gastrula zinc finger protein XlCGF57.1-like protein n=1 Tax=Lates japonicus TaxID=270547 RepID=A0AAD3R8C8_LATJO|nr:gastrula zinc finger protein XlCGF57.1-like protein [Lates japonicus]